MFPLNLLSLLYEKDDWIKLKDVINRLGLKENEIAGIWIGKVNLLTVFHYKLIMNIDTA